MNIDSLSSGSLDVALAVAPVKVAPVASASLDIGPAVQVTLSNSGGAVAPAGTVAPVGSAPSAN